MNNTTNLPATLSNRLAELTQRANTQSLVKHWQPQPNETTAGIITGSGTFTHSLYGKQKTMLLQDASGDVTSVILNKYLIARLEPTTRRHRRFMRGHVPRQGTRERRAFL